MESYQTDLITETLIEEEELKSMSEKLSEKTNEKEIDLYFSASEYRPVKSLEKLTFIVINSLSDINLNHKMKSICKILELVNTLENEYVQHLLE